MFKKFNSCVGVEEDGRRTIRLMGDSPDEVVCVHLIDHLQDVVGEIVVVLQETIFTNFFFLSALPVLFIVYLFLRLNILVLLNHSVIHL